MEIGVVVGLVIALGSLLAANALEGGQASSLINLPAMMIILGGTCGVTLVSVGFKNFLRVPKLFSLVLKGGSQDITGLVETMVKFAQKARREGLLALEEDIQGLPDRFMAKGLQMVVDGSDPEMVESVLMTEVELRERRQMADAGMFETAGGYAPTMGIIGTVMGLVHVLGNLDEPDKLGPAIAVAFLAALWGIAVANIICLPLAGKLKVSAKEEAEARHLIVEGIISIQKGDSPTIVREKLRAFLSEEPKPAKGEAVAGKRGLEAGEEGA